MIVKKKKNQGRSFTYIKDQINYSQHSIFKANSNKFSLHRKTLLRSIDTGITHEAKITD